MMPQNEGANVVDPVSVAVNDVFDADEEGRDIVDARKEVVKELKSKFGSIQSDRPGIDWNHGSGAGSSPAHATAAFADQCSSG